MVSQHNGVRYVLAIQCPKGQVVANRLDAIQDALWECGIRCDAAERRGCMSKQEIERAMDRALVMESLDGERHQPTAFAAGLEEE